MAVSSLYPESTSVTGSVGSGVVTDEEGVPVSDAGGTSDTDAHATIHNIQDIDLPTATCKGSRPAGAPRRQHPPRDGAAILRPMRVWAWSSWLLPLLAGCPYISAEHLADRVDLDDDGYAATGAGGEDCDDTSATTYPGATELPGDGVDADCDGRVEFGLYGEIRDGGIGGVIAVGDMDNDGVADLAVAAPDTAEGGHVYLIPGPIDDGSDERLAEAAKLTLISGEPGTRLGQAMVLGQDVDENGYTDSFIGAPGFGAGSVLVFPGSEEDLQGTHVLTGGFFQLVGDETGDLTGESMTVRSGDVRLLLIGAPGASDTAGRVYGFSTSNLTQEKAPPVSEAARVAIEGPEGGAFGWSQDAADLSCDGLPDFLVGAPDADEEAGAVAILISPVPDGSLGADDIDPWVGGETAGDGLGIAIAGTGDVDGDGCDDALIGAWQDSPRDAGYALVITGEEGGTMAVLVGEVEGDQAGMSVSAAGDLDGDGLDDLVVGAPDADGAAGDETGVVYLWLGQQGLTGTIALGDAAIRTEGTEAFYGLGAAVWGSAGEDGDLDGDGYPDVIMGAPGADYDASGAGALFLIYGAP